MAWGEKMSNTLHNRFVGKIALGLLLLIAAAIAGCQGNGESLATPSPQADAAVTRPPTPSGTPLPAMITPVQGQPTVIRLTVTSPIPTFTTTPSPTPTATPVPSPSFYLVQPGDTLAGVADAFGISLDSLLYANGYASPDEAVVIAGQELQIPTCLAHAVAPGNTLSGISDLCDITLDELVVANISALAPLGTLDAVPLGFVLLIPTPDQAYLSADCTAQPVRAQVIEYTPKPGEGPFCLSQKFNVSTASIVQANIPRLTGENVYGERPLLIPPTNGAVYIVTAEDVDGGIALADLAEWYLVPQESILDWNGNLVTGPLSEGQQLFVTGANLSAGPFQIEPGEEPQPTDDASSQGGFYPPRGAGLT